MMQLGALGFGAPWLLLGLVALPILWWLLRATPPAPLRERFPGVAILLGLEPPEKTPERTPWWLLLLRMLIAGLAILAFAQPLLNPREELGGEGPVRLVIDDGWASATDWDARIVAAQEIVDRADRAGRGVRIETLAAPFDEARAAEVLGAVEARARLEALVPVPWPPRRDELVARLAGAEPAETVWLHDGLDHAGSFGPLADALLEAGALRLIGPERTVRAVMPAGPEAEGLAARVLRTDGVAEGTAQVVGYSAAEDGTRRALAVAGAAFEPGETEALATFDVPLELRNSIAAFGLEGTSHAGAVALIDSRWRRQRVGLVSGERPEGNQRLLSGIHYLRSALEDRAELREGPLTTLLEEQIDALVLVDVGSFPEEEANALRDWVEAGGLLIRFAGPALAATAEERRFDFGAGDDPLLPVRLRPGGRDLGGAMSWGQPQRIAPFAPESPFFGLEQREDARISRQVLAEPDIDLPARTWASLTDGAPLVTSDRSGEGRIVLFHTTADPRWSTLPLSGLFIEMLDRIVKFGTGGDTALAETTGFWAPVSLIGADGLLRPAPDAAASVEGALIGTGASVEAPPGVYRAVGGEGDGAIRAHNLLPQEAVLTAAPVPPDGALVETLGVQRETNLKPLLIALALALFAIDAIAAFALAGKLRGAVAALALVAIGSMATPGTVQAQDDATERAMRAALDGALGYVITGDRKTDEIARAGLFGLTRALIERTSVEPADPVGVNLETDELAVYPLIYWAVVETQPRPSSEAMIKLNEFMRRGGMLVIDTRDQNLSLGGDTPGTRALRRLTAGLDLPPLSPVPEGHVLHRSFFLLDEFPGRWRGGDVWVEAVPPEDVAEAAESGGFRNDGVSPIVVGGHDWAGAWAIDEQGRPVLPVGGRAGARQREMAYRFGVNLVMYAYTGSYKSDQVHIPALLQRLGQ